MRFGDEIRTVSALGRRDSTKLDDFWEASPDASQHSS